MSKIKTQSVSGNIAAFLFYMISKYLTQSGLQKMSGRMQFCGFFSAISQTSFEFLLSTLTGNILVFGKLLIKFFFVYFKALVFSQFLGHFKRKSISGKQNKSLRATDISLFRHFFKFLHALFQGFDEFLFLISHRL